MSDLVSFLKKNQITKNNKGKIEETHTSLVYKTSGLYSITQKDYKSFINLYQNALQQQKNYKKPLLHLIEKRQDLSQITIDLDFQKKISINEINPDNIPRLYTQEFIKNFIESYMNIINQLLQINSSVEIFILEKQKSYHQKGCIKDGVHIQIPAIVVENTIQSIFRQKAIADDQVLKNYKNLQLSNQLSHSFDECSVKKTGWFMYGSMKAENEPYIVQQVFIYQNKQLQSKKITYDDKYFIKTLSIRDNLASTTFPQTDQLRQELDLTKKTKEEKQLKAAEINNMQQDSSSFVNATSMVSKLVAILSVERADDYNQWIQVGWCLKNIDNSLLSVWQKFSSQSSKYDNIECENLWKNKFQKRNMTIASLKMWANNDNPSAYQKIVDKSLEQNIFKSINLVSPQHFDIAQVIHQRFQGQFMCSDIKSNTWWKFHNHRWNPDDQGHTLYINISQDTAILYKQFLKQYQQQSSEAKQKINEHQNTKQSIENEIKQQKTEERDKQVKTFNKSLDVDQKINTLELDKKKTDNIVSQINKICSKLNNSSFKAGVMKEISYLFFQDDDQFASKLDTNPNIIGFTNGVYDLIQKKFRNGTPDDYLTLSTQHQYIEYNPKCKQIIEIQEYMKQVFVDNQTRQYFWYLLSTFISGSRLQEKFYFFNGCGSNSKSALVHILQDALGEYCTEMSVSAITQQRSKSNEANPELIKCKGKRLVIMQEPERNEKLNIGVMKEFTGGDRLTARQLYEKCVSFTPQFQMLLQCNHLPTVPSLDYGTWRRLQVITFRSLFSDNPNKSNHYEFKIDRDFHNKRKKWGPYMLSILIHQYPNATQQIYQVSSIINEDTNKYRKDCDSLSAFDEDCLETLDYEQSTPLTVSDIFRNYLQYCKQRSYTSEKQNDLKKYLNDKYQIQDLKNSILNTLNIKNF